MQTSNWLVDVSRMIPPIRQPSLEYTVELQGKNVIKRPKYGFAHKVKRDALVIKELGDLCPFTVYDDKNNVLVQKAVHGRFATEAELEKVRKEVFYRGWIASGLLPHDVIIQSNGKFKIVDVGHFMRR